MKTEQTPKHTPGHIRELQAKLENVTSLWQSAERDLEDTKKVNNELLEALEPLNKLADQCLDNSTLDKDQVVYAYNRAQITMSDLRKVRALISKCKNL